VKGLRVLLVYLNLFVLIVLYIIFQSYLEPNLYFHTFILYQLNLNTCIILLNVICGTIKTVNYTFVKFIPFSLGRFQYPFVKVLKT